jgi:hypothetical protein
MNALTRTVLDVETYNYIGAITEELRESEFNSVNEDYMYKGRRFNDNEYIHKYLVDGLLKRGNTADSITSILYTMSVGSLKMLISRAIRHAMETDYHYELEKEY